MIKVKIDGKESREYAKGTSVGRVISDTLGRKSNAIAAMVDGVEKDMSHVLNSDCDLSPIDVESEGGMYILRHSCAHLLAQAVTDIFPEAKPTIGPPIEHGFYYDFDMEPISKEYLPKIEKRMKQLSRKNLQIVREEYDNKTLRKMFSKNKFKIEIMDDKVGHDVGSSAYRQGEFVDLCRGPHVSQTSKIKWFRLTSTSQAYWRGDSKRKPLTRIYGICYSKKEDLKKREMQIEEASRRDHKRIGKEMELYMINEQIGKGLPLWLPNGEVLKSEIERFPHPRSVKYLESLAHIRGSQAGLEKAEGFRLIKSIETK